MKNLPEKIGQPITTAHKLSEDTFICCDLNLNYIMDGNMPMPKIFNNFHINTPKGTVHRVLGKYFFNNKECTEDEAFKILEEAMQKETADAQPNSGE